MSIERREPEINIFDEKNKDNSEKNGNQKERDIETENDKNNEEQYKVNKEVIEKQLDILLDDLSDESDQKLVENLINKLQEKSDREEEDLLLKKDYDEIIKELKDIEDKDNQEETLVDIKEIFKPFLELYAKDYHKLEEKWADEFNKKEGFKSLNRILSYGGSSETFHLHHPPSRTIPKSKRNELYLDGMRKLASILDENSKVKEITATGPLVIRMQKLLESFGFEISEMDESLRKRHFPDKEKNSVKAAKMNREDFLKIFLDKI